MNTAIVTTTPPPNPFEQKLKRQQPKQPQISKEAIAANVKALSRAEKNLCLQSPRPARQSAILSGASIKAICFVYKAMLICNMKNMAALQSGTATFVKQVLVLMCFTSELDANDLAEHRVCVCTL